MMREPTLDGLGSGCLMSGSGNMPHRAAMADFIRGAMFGTSVLFPCPIGDVIYLDRPMLATAPLGQALLVCWIWLEMFGNGQTNLSTSTRVRLHYVGVATISRKIPIGISLRHTDWISTGNTC